MGRSTNVAILTLLGLATCFACPIEGDLQTLYVNSGSVDCVGVGPQTCAQTSLGSENVDDWSLFYDNIQGFDRDEAYAYELVVNISTVENPSADASSCQYVLDHIVSNVYAGVISPMEWSVVSLVYNGTEVDIAASPAPLAAVFSAKSILGAHDGCNAVSYRYTNSTEGVFNVTGGAATLLPCESEITAAYQAALTTAKHFELQTATELNISNTDEQIEIIFAGMVVEPEEEAAGGSNSTEASASNDDDDVAESPAELSSDAATDGKTEGEGRRALMDSGSEDSAASQDSTDAPDELEDIMWILQSISDGGNVTNHTAGATEGTLAFHDSECDGISHCNNFFGTVTFNGTDELAFGALATTRMMCEENTMALETEYLAALARVSTWNVTVNGTLHLTGENGTLNLIFNPRDDSDDGSSGTEVSNDDDDGHHVDPVPVTLPAVIGNETRV